MAGGLILTRAVEISISEFGDEAFAEEAKRRGYPDQAAIEAIERNHRNDLQAEKRDRLAVIDRVLDEIRRGYTNEAVFWLEREHRDLEREVR